MQDQVVKPIYLSINQLTELFNNSIQDSSALDDHQNINNHFPNQDSFADIPLEFSFQALHLINSQKTINDIQIADKPTTNVLISKEQYQSIMLKMEQNRKLSEQYQKMIKENQEQIQNRKLLEDQNAAMLDQNFQIKREIQEMKQKLLICQSAIPLRKDKQIIQLRNQYKELQAKVAEKRETQQSTILTENSTADSDKSNSYYCNIANITYIIPIQVDQSESIKAPLIIKQKNHIGAEIIHLLKSLKIDGHFWDQLTFFFVEFFSYFKQQNKLISQYQNIRKFDFIYLVTFFFVIEQLIQQSTPIKT